MIKFLDLLGRYEAVEFSQVEAAELLGVGERTCRRWRQRFEDAGEAGLLDRRLGKASGKRVPADRGAQGWRRFIAGRYAGFTAKHFHEHLARDHQFVWGFTWTKTFLHSPFGELRRLGFSGPSGAGRAPAQAAAPADARHDAASALRRAQEGSKHEWLFGQPALDLIVTLDDATSAILSAFLVEEEGTASTFRALAEVFGEHGLPLSLYTDRGRTVPPGNARRRHRSSGGQSANERPHDVSPKPANLTCSRQTVRAA